MADSFESFLERERELNSHGRTRQALKVLDMAELGHAEMVDQVPEWASSNVEHFNSVCANQRRTATALNGLREAVLNLNQVVIAQILSCSAYDDIEPNKKEFTLLVSREMVGIWSLYGPEGLLSTQGVKRAKVGRKALQAA